MIPMKIDFDLAQKVKKLLSEAKTIAILSHISPDGDNVGSVLAMGHALMANCHAEVKWIKTDEIPEHLMFLSGTDDYIAEIGSSYDIAIVVDCGDLDRLGAYKNIKEHTKIVINIDHHQTNTKFGDINIVKPNASSTAELVFTLLKTIEFKITKECAEALYTGISTDTGSFKYSNTTSYTHALASELIDYGIDVGAINVFLYQNKSFDKMQLFIKSVNQMSFYKDRQIAITYVDQNMLDETKTEMNDSDGIVEFARNIRGVEVACLIKVHEADGRIKCSFRSKNSVDVSKFCEAHNGGGHVRAAGCTFETTDKQMVIDAIMKEIVL